MMSSKRMERRVDLRITEREVRRKRNWNGLREEIFWERWWRERRRAPADGRRFHGGNACGDIAMN
ncbi:U-box domain-containing protein 16 [Pyrus ussuriensis x Pyrus communis]|uniref:U-box domain-containing protein 16 n=1 Tax=Pyrus ussuriensis x Pyrus communis TaxID=2448454 RepID=A0A5N5FGJ0_9ROSA|nr:U-box domain-containing protein 16 [Pyrus ussuriensis x Pyrus communis]